jgi:hypothetical protein
MKVLVGSGRKLLSPWENGMADVPGMDENRLSEQFSQHLQQCRVMGEGMETAQPEHVVVVAPVFRTRGVFAHEYSMPRYALRRVAPMPEKPVALPYQEHIAAHCQQVIRRKKAPEEEISPFRRRHPELLRVFQKIGALRVGSDRFHRL